MEGPSKGEDKEKNIQDDRMAADGGILHHSDTKEARKYS